MDRGPLWTIWLWFRDSVVKKIISISRNQCQRICSDLGAPLLCHRCSLFPSIYSFLELEPSNILKDIMWFNTYRTLIKRSPLVPVPFPFGDQTIQDAIKDKKKKKKKLSKKLKKKGTKLGAAAAATATAVTLASSGNPIPGVGSTIPLVSNWTGFWKY